MSEEENNDDTLGDKFTYDPSWKGPMHLSRSLTDRNWLLIFPLYIAGYCIISIYIIVNLGNFELLTSFQDYKGRYCGYDLAVRQKPLLLPYDLRRCILYRDMTGCRGICVKQCPSENFIFTDEDTLSSVKEKLICTSDIELDAIVSFKHLHALLEQRKCYKWYLKSKHQFGKCVPDGYWKSHENETITRIELRHIHDVMFKNQEFVKSIVNQLSVTVGDIIAPVSLAIIFSGIVSVLSLILLRWIMIPLFALSVYVLCSVISGYIVKLLLSILQLSKGYTAFLVGIVLMQVIVVFIVFYCYRKILTGCHLVEVSNEAIFQLSATLAFPLLTCLLKLLAFALGVSVFLSLLTAKTENYKIIKYHGASIRNGLGCAGDKIYQAGAFCDPVDFKDACKLTDPPTYWSTSCEYVGKTSSILLFIFHVINAISCIWLLKFFSGLEHMIFSGAFASWYWSTDKKSVNNDLLIESAYIVLRYHFGTVAVGSFLITLVTVIYVAIVTVTTLKKAIKRGKDPGKNFKTIRIAAANANKIAQFFTSKALIASVSHGKSFRQSAKDTYFLLLRNLTKVSIVAQSVGWFLEITKLVISGFAVGIVVLYYHTHPELYVYDSTFYASLAVTGAVSFFVVSAHLSLQKTAVDTIFLCFLEDLERNDGSSRRPYYMDEKLKELIK